MKNQYRILYVESPLVSRTGERTARENTAVRVELTQYDMNNVGTVVGQLFVEIKGDFDEFTAEAKTLVEAELVKFGLIDQPLTDQLEEAKRLRWMDIVAIRDSLEAKGFEYLGKTFDSDTRSVLRLLGTVQAATMAEINSAEFSVDWTTADNTVITMTKEQVLGLPLAMASSINEIHIQARELRKSLDDAGSVEEVQLVKWPGVEYEVTEAYNPFDENGDLPAELQTETNSAES